MSRSLTRSNSFLHLCLDLSITVPFLLLSVSFSIGLHFLPSQFQSYFNRYPSQSCSLLISLIYIGKSNRYGLIDMYLTVLVAEFRT
ncbi:unnamed protein product [Arabidopsis lyrata]|nr:unnamed protein product [Arabidopsis lyrata]